MNKFLLSVFITFLFIVFSENGFSQKLSINLKDDNNQPLMGATLKLTKHKDKTEIYTTSNINGNAEFKDLEKTLYQLEISFIGYKTLEKTLNIKQDFQKFDFKLKEEALELDEVTVAARSPLIRQEDDKQIVDPEHLAAISNNTLEVLENTPGLYVDQDGGIFLSSASPAKVYINGREQKLTNQDITTILQNLPPNSVQKIEIMRTPSTKYDAASTGGIINIVLKKGYKIGKFGSINAGFNQSTYPNSELGFSFNDSGEKTSIYLNANYNHRHNHESLEMHRKVDLENIMSQIIENEKINHQFYTAFGINYDFSENTKFAYDSRLNYTLSKSKSDNQNFFKTIEDQIKIENENQILNDSYFLNLQQDFNLNHKFDTLGSEWDTKIGYNFSSRNIDQNYIYNSIFPFESSYSGQGLTLQDRNFINLQTDFTFYLKYKFKIETGAKSTIQYFNSNADFSVNYMNSELIDPIRTNKFNYFENINSAYFQASKTFVGNFVVKAGTRLEHTYMLGRQIIPEKTRFLINRPDLFPYFYLSRRVFKMREFELHAFAIYRRTISRPGYDMLNPSLNILDQFTYETGNPALKPQFTDNIELNLSFQDFPVFAVGKNYTSDIFSGVLYKDEYNSDITVRTYDNLGKNKETYFRGMLGIPPGGIYFFGAGGQYNYNEYQGFYQNQELNYKRGSWRFFTFHQLKITKTTRLVFSGFMMLNGSMDFYELKNFGAINIGLRQSFFNNRLQISLNARDILKTMIVEFEVNQNDLQAMGSRYTDNRRFGITLRYSFGIEKREKKANFLNGMQENF